jgi:hypothetical protein
MPSTYRHDRVDRDPPTRFECDLSCRPCGAPARDGGRCRRRVCIWLPYCWQHTRALLGVRVQPSGVLPGATGLFAARDFAAGEMVAPYVGERLTRREIVERYGDGDLALGPYLLHTVDAACVRGVGSASNGAFGDVPRAAANVAFHATALRHDDPRPAGAAYDGRTLTQPNLGVKYWSWAQRPIRAGEEIVANYGASFGYDRSFARRRSKCDALGVPCDALVRRRRSKRSR